MSQCHFGCLTKNCACLICGRKLKRDYKAAPHTKCELERQDRSPLQPCPHLGPSTGESTLVYGCGCSSQKANGIEVTVFECALHGECVTYARGNLAAGVAIKRCMECEDNPRRVTPT